MSSCCCCRHTIDLISNCQHVDSDNDLHISCPDTPSHRQWHGGSAICIQQRSGHDTGPNRCRCFSKLTHLLNNWKIGNMIPEPCNTPDDLRVPRSSFAVLLHRNRSRLYFVFGLNPASHFILSNETHHAHSIWRSTGS